MSASGSQAESAPAKICVNGQEMSLGGIVDVGGLIEHLKLDRKQIAVEVDGGIVSSRDLADRKLVGGETIEIVTLMGGG